MKTVRKAFNDQALFYDDEFTNSQIGQAQRKQVWRLLKSYIKPNMEVLEINCGTGTDAIELAKKGLKVIATDIAEQMIEKAQEKKNQIAENLNVQFYRMSFEEINRQQFPQRFDLVFSNFGGLNCISPETTSQLSYNLATLVKPKGFLFLVYMTKYCLWEKAYYLWKKDTENGVRRRKSMPVKVKLGEKKIDVWYHPSKEVATYFKPDFTLNASFPVGLFVPPSYLEHFFSSKKSILQLLEMMDQFLGFSLFSDYADHQALIFQKRT